MDRAHVTPADHANTVREARTKIVAALNLAPLVPPQADTETMNVVEEAWSALHDIAVALDALQAQAETAEAERDRLRATLDLTHNTNAKLEAERDRLEEERDNLREVILRNWPAERAERIIRAALAGDDTPPKHPIARNLWDKP